MTTHKTISTLSIAAIALLAAAAPSFAQAQSEPSSKEVPTAVPAMEQTLASNRELTADTKSRVATTEVERTSVDNAAQTARPSRLSASAFKVPNHFTSAESSPFITQQVNFNDAGPRDPNAKKQFRADDDESGSTKRIAFVPSRGQKLPE